VSHDHPGTLARQRAILRAIEAGERPPGIDPTLWDYVCAMNAKVDEIAEAHADEMRLVIRRRMDSQTPPR